MFIKSIILKEKGKHTKRIPIDMEIDKQRAEIMRIDFYNLYKKPTNHLHILFETLDFNE